MQNGTDLEERPVKKPVGNFMFRSVIWKIILPVPILLVAGIAVAMFFLPQMLERNIVDNAVAGATSSVNQFKVIRGYYTRNIVKKALGSGALKPSYNHKDDKGAIPLPATFIHDVSALLSQGGTRVSLFSAFPFPNRKERNLDSFQQQAWTSINTNPDSVFV
ncbi:MAG: hypothetical protein HN557_11430, partial [Rhodospirillaceae bacterium]|nr:hypothetical protein [Rhodospirillaceae bacterium]